MDAETLQSIRAMVVRSKRRDALFALVGIVALMVGVLTFAALFLDMAAQGLARIDADFLT
ncbi:MAG TPA: hypothetical protein PKC22_08370 [Rhodocyclaceae bacterium]|nr:hypothetical protein [Rhodocyclaceae bacterium]